MKLWHCSSITKKQKKTVRDACHETAKDVLEVWSKAKIATRLKKHVVDKIECTLCFKKTSPTFLAVTRESIVGFS